MKILIIEDDAALRGELDVLLRNAGYETESVTDFAGAAEQMKHSSADLILLDINLPNVNGETLLQDYRRQSSTPIIMLTSRTAELDEVLSMSYGADDFITKPYNPTILLLRISAVLKRSARSGAAQSYREAEVSTVRGEQNKKTMHLLEDLGNMGTEAIFTLCIPDGMTVSGQATAQEDFPSVTAGVSGGLQFPGQGKNPVAAILDPVLFAEYGIRYFPSAVDTASSAGLHYETEYLLAGKAEDRECLKEITNRLVLARTALNMLSILQDAEKKAEAEALAALIAGTTVVLAPLVSVLYYLILTVWAMMEAIADVRCLLSGGKVPLMKGPEDWTISLSGLVEQGKDAVSAGTEGAGHGMAYRDWMRLALLLTDKKTLRYRMMDMCQENLREQNGDFRMGECLFRMEAEFSGKGVLIPLRRRSVKEY